MSDPPAKPIPVSTELTYDTPLGTGQVRVHRQDDDTLAIAIGPPPTWEQVWGLMSLALPFAIFSAGLAVLVGAIAFRPGLVPLERLLVLPVFLIWGVIGFELGMSFKNWSGPTQIIVNPRTLWVPFPTSRSPLEEIPARLVVHVRVSQKRVGLLRRKQIGLEFELEHGPKFITLHGYPIKTLDTVCDLVGPVLGLSSATPGVTENQAATQKP